jgi:hypothetical protein
VLHAQPSAGGAAESLPALHPDFNPGHIDDRPRASQSASGKAKHIAEVSALFQNAAPGGRNSCTTTYRASPPDPPFPRSTCVKRLLRLLPLVAVFTSFAITPARATGPDFAAEVRFLARVVACDADVDSPEGAKLAADPIIVAHCKALGATMDTYRKEWLTPAAPFFRDLVPANVPKTVVYPFGGGDLMTALAVFPNLTEITSISLEAGGDPRGVLTLEARQLERALRKHREFMAELVRWNHNRTLDLAALKSFPIPPQLGFALVGLAVHGFEPVGLRIIELDAEGQVRDRDLDAASKGLGKGAINNRKRNDLAASYELRFRKKGETAIRIYRHFQANLANSNLATDDRILRHLKAKGRVSAMTKAASHLLWHTGFSTIRDYLKANIAWMVSDSTGINPMHLEPERWEQTVYGGFDTAIFNPTVAGQVAMRELFASQPKRPLPFKLFGYPTRGLKGLVIVTKPR